MYAPAAPPTTAPMIAPRAVFPVACPTIAPAAAPPTAPTAAPDSVLFIDAHPLSGSAAISVNATIFLSERMRPPFVPTVLQDRGRRYVATTCARSLCGTFWNREERTMAV